MPVGKASVTVVSNSAEEVAYKLLKLIAHAENKQLEPDMYNPANADRKWILDAYSDCFDAVRGIRKE